jgi:hypothetical protein
MKNGTVTSIQNYSKFYSIMKSVANAVESVHSAHWALCGYWNGYILRNVGWFWKRKSANWRMADVVSIDLAFHVPSNVAPVNWPIEIGTASRPIQLQ